MTEARRVLKARAELLARPKVKLSDDLIELVSFSVGNAMYCFESTSLSGVHAATDWTPLPGTPPFVVGLLAFRGRILSVLSLKTLLSLDDLGLVDHPKVLLLADEAVELGLVVDEVRGTVRLARAEILPVPEPASAYAIGLTRDHGAILDAGRVLGDPRILVYQGGSA